MVLRRAARALLLCGVAPFGACTVPSPAPAPTHPLGPEMQGASNSPKHLQIGRTLSQCARADQQRQQGGPAAEPAPSAEQCAEADRLSRSPMEYELTQPQ